MTKTEWVSEERKKCLFEHLRHHMPPGSVPSEVGYRVADLLSEVFGGLHHLEQNQMKKSKWTDSVWIECRFRYGDLATFDNDTLTRLVFLAHEKCIRVSIRSVTVGMLGIVCHPRKGTEGRLFGRHPTLQEAIETFQSRGTKGEDISATTTTI